MLCLICFVPFSFYVSLPLLSLSAPLSKSDRVENYKLVFLLSGSICGKAIQRWLWTMGAVALSWFMEAISVFLPVDMVVYVAIFLLVRDCVGYIVRERWFFHLKF